MKEKRKNIRVNISGEITFDSLYHKHSCGQKIQLLNISRGGVYIVSNKKIDVGETLHLEVNLIHLKSQFNICTKIVRESSNSVANRHFYGLKIFEALEKNEKDDEGFFNILKERESKQALIGKEFIDNINLLENILYETEIKCDDFDVGNPDEESQVEFLSTYGKEQSMLLTKKAADTYKLLKELSGEEHEIHKLYFQDRILYYFLKGELEVNRHMYFKPLGYAGDFGMGDYFYEDGYGNGSTFERFMWRYTMNHPLAKAHRNRKEYFTRCILDVIDRKEKIQDKIRIASFGSGSAVEMIDVLEKIQKNSGIEFVCVDGEKKALEKIENEIAKKKLSVKGKVILVHDNILEIVRKKKKIIEEKSQDFIYCAGFLDYLTDRVSKVVIKYMLRHLKDGEKLILVNVSNFDYADNFFMEIAAEWFLHQRSKSEMLELVDDLRNSCDISVEFDKETSKNIYLIIKKRENYI